MVKKEIHGKRLFVLDTNVLMHDPTALFRFKEHDIYLPMVVLEELDRGKKGISEVARNVRQVSRFIDELMGDARQEDIARGLPLTGVGFADQADLNGRGRLLFQTHAMASRLPDTLPGNTPDHTILGTALTLQQERPDQSVTLVSKDINLRIKATVLGIHAEDYYNDQVLDDVNLLYAGTHELPPDFWDSHVKAMDSWQESGRTFYRITGPITEQWHPSQFLYRTDEPTFLAMVRQVKTSTAVVEMVRDYTGPRHTVWGINARNREQNFALNLLMDPEVDFVSLVGAAGTGKTLLTLAAGLAQTLEENLYKEIIMTRVTVPVGEDIGFLPGTEEEKMAPWMGALMDNLEVLTQSDSGGDWGRAATQELLKSRVKIRSLNFMRGRTFLNRYVILDEAQNLTPKQMKTLITRAGPGTKVVCLGNVGQIDTPYLTETNSGLTFVVDRFKHWEHSGHITLQRGERSRLADFASTNL
ncbi:PhoH family protein [Ectothiorhodospira variabilis]|uniref:PhoH family protein n=1 Tax=Ectothiorhodospira variabilis TaxID=505694 RepID=UPI001EFB10AD|nr:PhoH family protein [Ectothiorhodospira variabilis]MCG5495807.1 PhoH family protein [Ectothiorhodospira variabilis]MCG5498722.1 PhoH family protein [Ectothiorhodospira variabilis]MCG5504759.1 PhoH family protein [Ectothiorhodospira variabilis]MCG5507916.1 PhoH family protein [Ectothiorhodospira variabilis]